MEEYRRVLIDFMKTRDWHNKIAKTKPNIQTLYEHSLCVYDIVEQIITLLGFTEEESNILRVSAVLHDAGKEKGNWQDAVKNNLKTPSHIDEEFVVNLIKDFSQDFKGLDENTILSCINLHHRVTQSTGNLLKHKLLNHSTINWKELQEIIDFADNLSSCGSLQNAITLLGNPEKFPLFKKLSFTYHQIYLRGVSSVFLHKACQSAYEKKGWKPVLFFAEGTAYFSLSNDVPSKEQIFNEIEKIISENVSKESQQLVVPNVIMDNRPIPMAELFDYNEFKCYLNKVRGRQNPSDYLKYLDNLANNENLENLLNKSDKVRMSYIYYKFWVDNEEIISKTKFKSDDDILSQISLLNQRFYEDSSQFVEILKKYSEEVIGAQTEVAIFKFFKASLEKDIWKKNIDEKVIDGYEDFFGKGSFKKLKSMSNNDYPNEMAYSISFFWNIEISKLEIKLQKQYQPQFKFVKDLKQPTRKKILIDILTNIWKQIDFDKKPHREISNKMSVDFIKDIISIEQEDIIKIELEYYKQSKINSKKESGCHICPICNAHFLMGKKTTADIVQNPEGFTNRAISHGKSGKIVICEACRSEIYLRQIILGNVNFQKSIYLFPKFNASQLMGREFYEKVDIFRQKSENLMSEYSDDPELTSNLSRSNAIARNVTKKLDKIENLNIEDFIFTQNSFEKNDKELEKELLLQISELHLKKDEIKCLEMIYNEFEETLSNQYKQIKNKKLKDFEKEVRENSLFRNKLSIENEKFKTKELNQKLKEHFDGDIPIERNLEKSLEIVNERFSKNYKNWDEFWQNFKKNNIDNEIARKVLKSVFKLTPKFKVLAQTSNFVIVPLINPIKHSDDAKVNSAIRELFISIIFSLKLNCSVAIADSVKQLTLFDKIGSAYVEENSHLREIVGDSWLQQFNFMNEKGSEVKSMKIWLEAIASTFSLSHLTNYSERTNLLEILTSKTKGHLLRRIEAKSEKAISQGYIYKYIEKIWEVRK